MRRGGRKKRKDAPLKQYARAWRGSQRGPRRSRAYINIAGFYERVLIDKLAKTIGGET